MTQLGGVEAALQQAILRALPDRHRNNELQRFYRLLAEYPTRGGKRLRGRLLLLACQAQGGPWRQALPAAAALELFQNWVLVHDDIEDASEERRGAPTLHRQVGIPIAINVGDALHVYMWELLLTAEALPRRQEVVMEFLAMIHRTAEGQHLELSWIADDRFDIDEASYLEMVSLKTARYTVVSPLRLGALCAGVAPDPGFEPAGRDLGIAFQIRDDVLNLVPGEGLGYGKEFAGDLYEGKRTLILAHFFAHANSADRLRAIEVLTKARERKTKAEIEELLASIERYGSMQYAQQVAEDLARRGLATVREALGSSADQAVAAELAGLLETLAFRQQ